jgi:hypothetical protein
MAEIATLLRIPSQEALGWFVLASLAPAQTTSSALSQSMLTQEAMEVGKQFVVDAQSYS